MAICVANSEKKKEGAAENIELRTEISKAKPFWLQARAKALGCASDIHLRHPQKRRWPCERQETQLTHRPMGSSIELSPRPPPLVHDTTGHQPRARGSEDISAGRKDVSHAPKTVVVLAAWCFVLPELRFAEGCPGEVTLALAADRHDRLVGVEYRITRCDR